jgi:hypothetical protein
MYCGAFFGSGIHGRDPRCITRTKKVELKATSWRVFLFRIFRMDLSQAHRFSCITLRASGIAMLTVLAITRPLQAQPDPCVTSRFHRCDARTNLHEDDAPDAASFGILGRAAGAAVSGPAAESEVPPRILPANPFVTLGVSRKTTGSCSDCPAAVESSSQSGPPDPDPEAADSKPLNSKEPSVQASRRAKAVDRNRSIYYKNKLEFSLEGGWLPINIPFAFDFLLGDNYEFPGLYYTLVPIMASVRWHLDDIRGPVILRGNWDVTFTASATAIPRGAETHYFAYIMGIRRNFVPRRWKVVPYVDGRLGLGDIDAKGPLGVKYAQGQNFTFTFNLGSGLRYNFNSKYAIHAGLNYMHISNLYLSQPKFLNYGINVYGPWFGIDIRFGKRRPAPQ